MSDILQKPPNFDKAMPAHTLTARPFTAHFLKSGRTIGSVCFRIGLDATVAVCLAVVSLVAPGTAVATQGFDASVVSDSGNYVVEYRTRPRPIPMNEMFEMTVIVRERLKKSPAQNVSLEVDAGMSEHNHGMNTMPVVERLTNGQFGVRGMLFHMAGKWELTFSIKRGILSDKAEQVVNIR